MQFKGFLTVSLKQIEPTHLKSCSSDATKVVEEDALEVHNNKHPGVNYQIHHCFKPYFWTTDVLSSKKSFQDTLGGVVVLGEDHVAGVVELVLVLQYLLREDMMKQIINVQNETHGYILLNHAEEAGLLTECNRIYDIGHNGCQHMQRSNKNSDEPSF